MSVEAYLKPKDLVAPASEKAIEAAERALRTRFPADCPSFLAITNGCIGGKGHFGRFHAVGELIEETEGYDFMADFPGMILIGSNGGPAAYGLLSSPGETAYVAFPFDNPVQSQVRKLGGSFPEPLQSIAKGEGW